MYIKNKLLHFHANGKLLLSGEYFVLNGTKALALPSKLGQSLHLFHHPDSKLFWRSFDQNKNIWFEATISFFDLKIEESSDPQIAQQLEKIFSAIRKLNPSFLQSSSGLLVETHLDFPRLWGLGTSSTLIACMAKWAALNPFQLLADTFGGSGYDLACADSVGPIVYWRENELPKWKHIVFNPEFKEQLYFVYLEKKQNSRTAIAHYHSHKKSFEQEARRISEITNQLELVDDLFSFEKLMDEHERIIAQALKLEKAKDLYFPDYWGSIKSLGAWGGDFVLATSNQSAEETKEYFNQKAFPTVLKYKDLVL